MPLHLLGKKSWNVYNSANIERVRHDEAQAQAREEALEQRMQEEDAAHRIAILRGDDYQPAQPLVEEVSNRPKRSRAADDRYTGAFPADADDHSAAGHSSHASHERKRQRRLRGEDDTDRDIRLAREDAAAGQTARETLSRDRRGDAELVNHAGHIQLFPLAAGDVDEKHLHHRKGRPDQNPNDADRTARRQREEEDQVTLRFNNAAGFKRDAGAKPWYASGHQGTKSSVPDEAPSTAVALLADAPAKDVWGNDDPRRVQREQSRVSSSDPFAVMQRAQRQLRQSEVDRERWKREKEAEMEEVEKVEAVKRRRRRRRERDDRGHGRERRRGSEDEGSLDGSRLDGGGDREKSRDRSRRREDGHRSHGHGRRRSRSRSRDRRK